MPIGPELKELLERAVGNVIDGVKRVEIDSSCWKIVAYRVVTTIRVEIKPINRLTP